MEPKVTVYQYMYWDEEANRRMTSTLYATLDAVRNGLGTAVPGTAMDVPCGALRDGGIFVPALAPERKARG